MFKEITIKHRNFNSINSKHDTLLYAFYIKFPIKN